MKHTLFTFSVFIFLFHANAISQVNTYFENNPIWTINSACSAPLPCLEYETKNYFIKGDTLINNLIYKSILKKGEGYYQNLGPPAPGCDGSYWYIDTIPSFFLRSLNKQMFVRFPSDTTDQLLYDFDLEVGDTLPISYNHNSTIVVLSIDSVNTQNGYLKIFELAGNNSTPYLVEGIGSSAGLIEPYEVWLECSWTLTCYSLNDTSYFPISGLSCNLSIGIGHPEDLENIFIFPNPGSGSGTMSLMSYINNASLTIYNYVGESVKVVSGIYGQNITLAEHNLESGIYFLSLSQDQQIIAKGKWIIIKN